MATKIEKVLLPYCSTHTHALVFTPETLNNKGAIAIFAHGYTSHKGSILTWASRLADEGIPTVIFDWPGHYLGNFSEVESFEEFKSEASKLFLSAYEALKGKVSIDEQKVILGGHSLGALMSLHALEYFNDRDVLNICVGFGVPPKQAAHLFDTPFYKSTLNLRGQLVSPAINPEVIFPWIKQAKENLDISKATIYLLTGEDDMVVGKTGSEEFKEILENLGNQVTLEKPKRLAHHQPEMAASHIKKFLKDLDLL